MSRQLDLENLDEDDLAYLAQRELLVQEIIAVTGENPLEGYDPEENDPLGEFKRPVEAGTRVAGSATVTVPGFPDSGPEVSAWNETMKKAQLQEVIDQRNENREEDQQIVPEGDKKADLVAALEADDELANETHNSLVFPQGDPEAELEEEDEG